MKHHSTFLNIDFLEIEHGSDFETLIQELLQELGYHAETTGDGPDAGVDIIAEKIYEDPIGRPLTRRYVIQCKHYAHSGSSVGIENLGGLSIVDCIEKHQADGYLLACSTRITSNLRRSLIDLKENSGYDIEYWDKVALHRQLQSFPSLAIRYFPLTSLKYYSPKRPQNEPRGNCYDRVKRHQETFIGTKFIPELYITREIESQIYQGTLSPVDQLDKLEAKIESSIAKLTESIDRFVPPPLFIQPSIDGGPTFKWTTDFRKKWASLTRVIAQIARKKLNLSKQYRRGGVSAVHSAFDDLNDQIKSTQRLARDIISQIDVTVEDMLNEEEKRKPNWKKFSQRNPLSKVQAGRKFLDESICSSSQTVQQNMDSFDRDHAFSEILGRHTRDLKATLVGIQVIVDVAGSGKTNMFCRLALQLTHRCFVVFLTGRSHRKEFDNVSKYVQEVLRLSFPRSTSENIEDYSSWLEKKGYPLVLIIDGINESPDIAGMNAELINLQQLAAKAPIRIIMSSRSEYWSLFERNLDRRFSIVRHGELSRFTEAEFDSAIPVYLKHFKLSVRIEGMAWQRMRRPILLRFFCEAYGNPRKDEFRRLPAIREVQLKQLFDEYCRVKYESINTTMERRRERVEITPGGMLTALAGKLLLQEKSSILLEEVSSDDLFAAKGSNLLYRALLDEDIILEEFPDPAAPDSSNLLIGFVYEAFMEYLMTAWLLAESIEDEILEARLAKLIERSAKFAHIRGIATFLAPECVPSHPQSFRLLLEFMKEFEFRDLCVPALLNMWNCDWEQGIFPLLKIIGEHYPVVAIDEVKTFVREWTSVHGGGKFIGSVRKDPHFAIRVMGEDLPEMLRRYESENTDDLFEASLEVLRISERVDFSRLVIKSVFMRRGDARCWLSHSDNFPRLVRSCARVADVVRSRPLIDRDWHFVWDLADVGQGLESASRIGKWDRFDEMRDPIRQAIFDSSYRYGSLYDSEAIWWTKALGENMDLIDEIEKEVTILREDPVRDEDFEDW